MRPFQPQKKCLSDTGTFAWFAQWRFCTAGHNQLAIRCPEPGVPAAPGFSLSHPPLVPAVVGLEICSRRVDGGYGPHMLFLGSPVRELHYQHLAYFLIFFRGEMIFLKDLLRSWFRDKNPSHLSGFIIVTALCIPKVERGQAYSMHHLSHASHPTIFPCDDTHCFATLLSSLFFFLLIVWMPFLYRKQKKCQAGSGLVGCHSLKQTKNGIRKNIASVKGKKSYPQKKSRDYSRISKKNPVRKRCSPCRKRRRDPGAEEIACRSQCLIPFPQSPQVHMRLGVFFFKKNTARTVRELSGRTSATTTPATSPGSVHRKRCIMAAPQGVRARGWHAQFLAASFAYIMETSPTCKTIKIPLLCHISEKKYRKTQK